MLAKQVEIGEQSLFKHEQNAIKEIQSKISGKNIGQMVGNVELYDEQTDNYYEYDLIFIGKTSIYVIELKHWTGNIEIKPYNWVVDGTKFRKDPHKTNGFKCKILKGIYQHHFRTYPNIWVQSVVVLTNPQAIVEGDDNPKKAAQEGLNTPTFASISDFITYLSVKEGVEEKRLNENQVQSIKEYLSKINQPTRGIKYNIQGYETIDYISQKPDFIELLARPKEKHARGLFRFRVFRPPYEGSQEEKDRFSKKAYNTLSSIQQLGDHPHILKVWVFKNDDDDDIIEGSEWSETGTLRDIIENEKDNLPLETAMQYCKGIAEAIRDAQKKELVHRAIKPENVLIFNDIPKLMNFDLAYQIEDDRITVIEDVSKLKDDGYISPEIIFGRDIDETTDYFSLGVIAIELFTGKRFFKSTKEFVARGGELHEDAIISLEKSNVPQKTINVLKKMVQGKREQRINNANEIIDAFNMEKPGKTQPYNGKLNPGDTYDLYEIEEFIGVGNNTQIYKAKNLRGESVIIKLFNKEVSRERVLKEEEKTKAVSSSYVVRCKGIGHWQKDRYFLVFDHLEGKTMRELINEGIRPDLDYFRTIAVCLLQGIKAFHCNQDQDGNIRTLLHNDIKPENIIVSKDKKATLIDCGIASEPKVDSFEGTTPYIPPDSLVGSDREYREDGDLFALGVTLWEWLFGDLPYTSPSIGDKPKIPVKNDSNKNLLDTIANWLLKAVATEKENRFSNVVEMKETLMDCFKKVSEKDEKQKMSEIKKKEKVEVIPDTKPKTEKERLCENPFVYYLNSLSNTSSGNENATAEAQIGNEFFDRILVENPVSDFIFESLLNKKQNVILTGNAGDGKTTIAVEVIRKLTGRSDDQELEPIVEIPEKKVRIVKDMSELSKAEQMKIIKEAASDNNHRYFFVTNTGTFLKSFGNYKVEEKGESGHDELLKALKAEKETPIFEEKFWVLNIGRLNSIETAIKVFEKMVFKENWKDCLKCDCSNDCPIFYNVKVINEKSNVIFERVKLIYRRLFEYNNRLTLRQMTGHLAYAITAGKVCSEVMKLSKLGLEEAFKSSLFFDRFFGDNGKEVVPEALQLLPIRFIREAEFGSFLDPEFEREAWLRRDSVSKILGDYPECFQRLKGHIRSKDEKCRRQFRRLVFFCREVKSVKDKKFILNFLGSPMLLNFIGITSREAIGEVEENQLRKKVLQVLQEFFTGMRFLENGWDKDVYITLKRRTSRTATQLILAEFKNDDFALKIDNDYKIGNEIKRSLYLALNDGAQKLKLDLPFLDFIIKSYEGEVAEELSAYYADRLERFKVDLLENYQKRNKKRSQQLFLLTFDSDRKPQPKRIAIKDDRLEVL